MLSKMTMNSAKRFTPWLHHAMAGLLWLRNQILNLVRMGSTSGSSLHRTWTSSPSWIFKFILSEKEKIGDGEDVGVLRSPDLKCQFLTHTFIHFYFVSEFLKLLKIQKKWTFWGKKWQSAPQKNSHRKK